MFHIRDRSVLYNDIVIFVLIKGKQSTGFSYIFLTYISQRVYGAVRIHSQGIEGELIILIKGFEL